MICNNNLKIHRMIIVNYVKGAQFTNNRGAEVARIKEIIEDSKIKFNFRFIKGHNKITRLFTEDLGLHLVKICNRKVKIQ